MENKMYSTITPSVDDLQIEKVHSFVSSAQEEITRKSYLVIDMKNVNHINSTGIGALLHIFKYTNDNKKKMAVANLQEGPFELIELIGAHSILPIYKTIDDFLVKYELD